MIANEEMADGELLPVPNSSKVYEPFSTKRAAFYSQFDIFQFAIKIMPNYEWIKIALSVDELDFGTNDIAFAEINGKRICIGRYSDKLFAFAYKCPHAGGVLADGYIDAIGNVVCPLHRYKFNIANGRNTSGEGYYLKHWPVEQREDGIYVAQDKKNLFGLF